jgi:hypothetical protein
MLWSQTAGMQAKGVMFSSSFSALMLAATGSDFKTQCERCGESPQFGKIRFCGRIT